MDTEERVAVDMCGFDSARNSNYFEGDKLSRNEGEMSDSCWNGPRGNSNV